MAHIPQMIGTISNYEEAQRIKKIMSSSLPKAGFIYVDVGDVEGSQSYWLSALEKAINNSHLKGDKGEAIEAITPAITRGKYANLQAWLKSEKLTAALAHETTPALQTAVDALREVDIEQLDESSEGHKKLKTLLNDLEKAIEQSSLPDEQAPHLRVIDRARHNNYQPLYDWLDSDELKTLLKNEKTPALQAIVEIIRDIDFTGYTNKDTVAYLDAKHGVMEASMAAYQARLASEADPLNEEKKQTMKAARLHAAESMGRARPSLQPVTLRCVKLKDKAAYDTVLNDFLKLGVRGWTYAHHYYPPRQKTSEYEYCAVIPCTFPRRLNLPDKDMVKADPERAAERVGEYLVKQMIDPEMVKERYGDEFFARAQAYEHKRLDHLGIKWRDYQKGIPKREFERDTEGTGLFLAYLLAKKQITPEEIEEGYGKGFVEAAFNPENVIKLKERLNLDWPYAGTKLNDEMARRAKPGGKDKNVSDPK